MACNCGPDCNCNCNTNQNTNGVTFKVIDNSANISDYTLAAEGQISANEKVAVIGLGNGKKIVVPGSEQLRSDYLTKTEASTLLDEKMDKHDSYTRTEVDNKILESEKNIHRNENLINALALKANKNETVNNDQLQLALSDFYRKREVYNKDEMNAKLDTKASITEVYNKNVINNILADKVSSNEVYNKKEMNTFLDSKANKNEVYSRNDVYTKFEIDAKISHLDKFDDALYYDRNIIDIKLNDKADKDEFYTKLEMDFALDKKVDKLEISNTKNDLSVAIDKKMDKFTYNAEKVNFAAKQDVYSRAETYNRSEIDVKLASLSVAQPGQQQPVSVDLSNYYTKADVERMNSQKADITLIGDLASTGLNSRTNVADALTEVKSLLDSKVNNVTYALEKQQFATKTELSAKADTNDLRATLNLIGDRSEMPSTSDTITTNIRLLNSRLSNKIDVGEKVNFALKVDTYTKAEVDSAIARVSTGGTVDLRNYYNRQEVDDKIGLLVSTGLTGTSVADQLADAKRRIDAIPSTGGSSNGNVNLNNYYTKAESDGKYALITDLSNKVDSSVIGTLGNTGVTGNTVEAQITEVKRLIDAIPSTGGTSSGGSASVDLSNYYTKAESDGKYALSSDLSNKVDSSVIGDLQGTGLTGSTVTELFASTKRLIDAIPSTGGTSSGGSTSTNNANIGDLQGTGLTGSTVTELLTDAKNRIDAIPSTVKRSLEPVLFQYPDNFSSFINTSSLSGLNLELIGSDGNTAGSLEFSGGYLTDGSLNSTKVSKSDIIDGALHIICDTTTSALKGNCVLDRNASIISVAFGLYIPTQSGQGSYTPMLRFFNSATGMAPENIMGGIEIHTDGKFYITKANNGNITNQGLAYYSYDTLYNVVVEYNGTNAKLFLNGELAGTATIPTNYVSLLRTASYISISNPGINNKAIDMHIGNIAIYSRELTENEKKNTIYINGKNSGLNSYNRINDAVSKINNLENIKNTVTNTADVIELLESNNWIQSHTGEKLLPKMKNLIFNLDNNTFKSNGSAPGQLMVSSSSKLRKGSVEQSNFNTDVTSTASSSNWGYKNTNVMYIGREVEDLNITIPADKSVSCANGFSIWISATPKENFVNRSWSDLFYISSRSTFSGGNTDHRDNNNNLFRIEAGNTSDSNNKASINIYGNTTLTTEKCFTFDTKTNILVTVKDSKLTLYVDGEKVGVASLGATNLIPTYIGLTKANTTTVSNKFPNVEIDSISMWNVALRDDEVEAVFNSRQ